MQLPLFIACCLISALPIASDLWVDASQPNCPGTGSPADPFCRIQDAIVAANPGDRVRVRPGTYLESIDFLGKAIVVESTAGPEQTIIDAQGLGSVVLFNTAEGSASVLRGFKLFNGAASTGGGIYCGALTSPTITNNDIIRNYSGSDGGGIYCASSAAPLIERNRVLSNTAGGRGGGLACGPGSSPIARYNDFNSNTAGSSGGGVSLVISTATLVNNTMDANSASAVGYGGGLYLLDSSPTLIGNLVTANFAMSGGGVASIASVVAAPILVNMTIADNYPNGFAQAGPSYAGVTNSIVWSNYSASVVNTPPSAASITYSDIQGGFPGTGNVSLNPFFEKKNEDYRLSCNSGLIDAGATPAGVPLPAFDFHGGDRRVAGSAIDIGADEAGIHWDLSGTPTVGGPPVNFRVRAPASQAGHLSEVYLSFGAGTTGGIPVPGSGGRLLELDIDLAFGIWLGAPSLLRQAILTGCSDANAASFTLPPSVPIATSISYSGVSWNLGTGQVVSISPPRSFKTQ